MPLLNEGDMLPEKHRNRYRHNYQDTRRPLTSFFKLFRHWRGSVIKIIFHNLIIFLLLYFFLAFLYRVVFIKDDWQRACFELVCKYARRGQSYIPLNFLIGFYVQQVVSRWWNTFSTLPFPDKIAMKLVSFVPGKESFPSNLRRTVMRYVNLSTLLVYRLVSSKVKTRFPTLDSLVEARLLLPHEADRLQRIDFRTPHEATWAPVLWALKLLGRAREEGKVKIDPPIWSNLVSSFEYVEDSNRRILNYGWVEFPLAYTQVATFSVNAYFLGALFGRQFLLPAQKHGDLGSVSATMDQDVEFHDIFFPFFTIVEFISYYGWIKVAETLLNPFGDDDEDFEINYLIDRNLQVSYLIVDEADNDLGMATDPFLEAGISVPEDLPYQTQESKFSVGPSSTKSIRRILSSARASPSPSQTATPRSRRSSGHSLGPGLTGNRTENARPLSDLIEADRPLSDLMEVDHENDQTVPKAEAPSRPVLSPDTFSDGQGSTNQGLDLEEGVVRTA